MGAREHKQIHVLVCVRVCVVSVVAAMVVWFSWLLDFGGFERYKFRLSSAES